MACMKLRHKGMVRAMFRTKERGGFSYVDSRTHWAAYKWWRKFKGVLS